MSQINAKPGSGGSGSGGVELGGAQTGFTNGQIQFISQSGLQGGDDLFTFNSTTKEFLVESKPTAATAWGYVNTAATNSKLGWFDSATLTRGELGFNSAEGSLSYGSTATGQLSETVLGATNIQSNYTLDGTTNYRTELSNGRFKFGNSTSGVNFLDLNDITGGIAAKYEISNNFLGFGLTGAGQVFDIGTGAFNLLASVDTTAFGGSPNTTFTGYTSFGPGPVANAQYSYNATTDLAAIALKTKSSTAKSAQINVESNVTTAMVELEFDTGNYKFPTTSPSSGQVMGYSSANQLGFINPITIGNAISGSSANRVLFANGSNNLAQSANFTFNTSTNAFAVGSGNTLAVNSTNGVVATSASSVDAFSAVTPYGQAFRVNTAGGMGQLIEMGDVLGTSNLTKFSVTDSAKQIIGILDGEFAVYRATGTSAKALLVKTDNLGTGQLLVEAGDISGVINGTKFSLNDSAQTITAKLGSTFTIRNLANERIASFSGANESVLLGAIDGGAEALVEIVPTSSKVAFTGSEFQNSTVEIDSAVSTTYTVLDGDRIIYVNTNTAGVTITLPSVSTYDKRLVKIKCTGTNAVTIVASAGSVDTGSLATGEVGEWQALNSTITWQRVQ